MMKNWGCANTAILNKQKSLRNCIVPVVKLNALSEFLLKKSSVRNVKEKEKETKTSATVVSKVIN